MTRVIKKKGKTSVQETRYKKREPKERVSENGYTNRGESIATGFWSAGMRGERNEEGSEEKGKGKGRAFIGDPSHGYTQPGDSRAQPQAT